MRKTSFNQLLLWLKSENQLSAICWSTGCDSRSKNLLIVCTIKVDLVVNHNVPQLPKAYVHRVGRAARAGRAGSAITFVTQYDVGLLQGIEKLIKCQLIERKVGHKNVSQYVTQVLVAKREAEIKLDEQDFGEKKEINKRKQMIMEGLDPDEVEKAIERQKKRRKIESKKKVEKLKMQTKEKS